MNTKNTPRNKMTGFVVMRGGIEEPTDAPDCKYWERGAERAREKVYELMLVNDRTNKILFKYWKEENTWMYIFDRTARMQELVKLLCVNIGKK